MNQDLEAQGGSTIISHAISAHWRGISTQDMSDRANFLGHAAEEPAERRVAEGKGPVGHERQAKVLREESDIYTSCTCSELAVAWVLVKYF